MTKTKKMVGCDYTQVNSKPIGFRFSSNCYLVTIPSVRVRARRRGRFGVMEGQYGLISYRDNVCGSMSYVRSEVLREYNTYREEFGLPLLKRLPASTKMKKKLPSGQYRHPQSARPLR